MWHTMTLTRVSPSLLTMTSAIAFLVVADQPLKAAGAHVANDEVLSSSSDFETRSSKLVPATFAAGDWHVAEGRFGCMRGVNRTVVGHTSINVRQPTGPQDTLYIGDEVESVRVW